MSDQVPPPEGQSFPNLQPSQNFPAPPPTPPAAPGFTPSPAYSAPQQPGYAQPQSGYGPPQGVNPFDSRSTTILILGILSIVVCGIMAPIAWVMGNNLKKEAQAAGYPEPGNAKAGRIIGMVVSILYVVLIVLFVVLGIIGAVFGGSQ
jgi:hypothetical protein